MRGRLAAALGLLRSLVVYHGQPWRVMPLRRFMRRIVTPGMLAFDIGAHAGNRTLALSKAGARVVALEPQPLFAPILRHLARRRAIIVRTEAVGSAEGRARLQISSRHPTLSSTVQGWPAAIGGTPGFGTVRWDTEVEVPVVTLDRLIAEHGRPDFVKIDVEGSEAAILEGLSEPIPLVAFEYLAAAHEIGLRCIQRLQALGDYEFNLVIGERQHFHEENWLSRETLIERLENDVFGGRSGDIYARLVPAGRP